MLARLIVVVGMFAAVGGSKPAPSPADYPLTVHVKSSHTLSNTLTCDSAINCAATRVSLQVTVGGEFLELISSNWNAGLIRIGDYKARIKMDYSKQAKNPTPSYEDHRLFELLLPDGKTEEFGVVSEYEENK